MSRLKAVCQVLETAVNCVCVIKQAHQQRNLVEENNHLVEIANRLRQENRTLRAQLAKGKGKRKKPKGW